MPCRAGGLAPLTVLAVALLLAPAIGARPSEEPAMETVRVVGEWTRFRAFDGTECIPDQGSGTFEAVAVRATSREVRFDLDGTAECASLNYTRGFGGTWMLDGRPKRGYSWENRAWCAFVRVGPLPDSPDDAWRIEAGEYNEILGGCEVFEGTARMAPAPLLPALPGALTGR